jgi:hypothetical protein
MSCLARNLQILYRGHPELERRRLEDQTNSSDLEILESAAGVPTARLAGTYLHSRYDPVREADAFVDREASGEISTAVFYGFGLGYQVEAFRRRHPGIPGVVIEPDGKLFVDALRCRDLGDTLSAPELFWHIDENPEAAMMTLEALPIGKLRVLRPRPSVSRAADYFRRVDAAIRSLLDRREVNLNTLKRFGKLWLRNLLDNVSEFAVSPGVERLKGRFDGIPTLVLAAGPSLDELLPLLAQLRERLLLIAVDTSHRLCQEAGGEPDLLVTVDPQYWNSRHLDRADICGAVVVSESSGHPRIFRKLEKTSSPLYFISSFFPLGRLLEEAVGWKGRVGAGGSVATTAWDLARLLGCRPVFVGGLDLGYPGARTHCRGAYFEERAHLESTRLFPAETTRHRVLHNAGPTWMENNAGGLTMTDRRLLIYKWWFENQLSQIEQEETAGPPMTTFSLAAEGLSIRGMPYKPPAELLDLPVIRPLIEPKIEAIRLEAINYRRQAEESRRRAAAEALAGLSHDLERLKGLSARALSVCVRLRESAQSPSPPEGGSAGLYRELDELDTSILELSSRNVVGFLFQGLIHHILDSPGSERSPDEILEVSEELYREMEGSADYHLNLITTAILRIGIF